MMYVFIGISLIVAVAAPRGAVTAELRARENVIRTRLTNSVMRVRYVSTESRDSATDQTTVKLSEVRRMPDHVRVFSARMRPGQDETWDFEKPNWEKLGVVWDMEVSKDRALMMTWAKDSASDPDEFIGLLSYDVLPWSEKLRFEIPLNDDAATLRSVIPGESLTMGDIIGDDPSARVGRETEKIDGASCRPIYVQVASGLHTFWIDPARRSLVVRFEVDRKATDVYFGRPLWQQTMTPEEIAAKPQPDDADLAVRMHSVITFSDFREISDGELMPWRAEIELEWTQRESQSKTEGTIEITSLENFDKPLPLEAMQLCAPEGTPVIRVPRKSDDKFEWRNGQVVPATAPSGPSK